MEQPERPIRPEFLDLPPQSERVPQAAGFDGLTYLRLFRAPNVFTAIADVSMGYLLTTRSLADWPGFVLLVIASALLYTSGMVLNDVFDVEIDRRERPNRPLPSGRISVAWAKWLGIQFLLMGWGAATLAGFAPGSEAAVWRSGAVGLLLCLTILGYDGGAKRSAWFGPWVMGGCRFWNVLLGMSLHAAPSGSGWNVAGYSTGHLLVAAGIGIYIVGVTYFARSEATVSPRPWLIFGIVWMATGIACLAFFPRFDPELLPYRYEITTTWPMAWLFLSVWILRRALVAVRDPGSTRVQGAVKLCILSLIVMDAMLCSFACDWPYAVGIVALLVPSVVLGRWVYST